MPTIQLRIVALMNSGRRLAAPVALAVACVLGVASPGQANVPPTIRFTSPLDCALVELDQAQRTFLEVDAFDSDGAIVAVRFYTEYGLCSVDSFPPFAADCYIPIIIENLRKPSDGFTTSALASPLPSTNGVPAGECACDIASYQWYTRTWAIAVDNLGATASSDTIGIRPSWFGPALQGPFLATLDPGFEAVPLADGDATTGPGTIGGWTFAGSAGATFGVLNPTAASFPAAGGNGTPTGAEGANVAFLSVPAGDADSAHVFQALPDTLRTYSRYWLELAAGSPLDGAPDAASPFDGATFELWAGTDVIFQGRCNSVWTKGEFFALLGSVASDQLPPSLIGEPLSIHIRLGAGATSRSIHVDRVRLKRERYVTPGVGVPESPAAGFAARAVPNPAPGAAAIEFAIERGEVVALSLFDATGRAVRPRTSRWLAAGPQRLVLPDDLAPGLYFARLDAGSRSQTVRVVRLGP